MGLGTQRKIHGWMENILIPFSLGLFWLPLYSRFQNALFRVLWPNFDDACLEKQTNKIPIEFNSNLLCGFFHVHLFGVSTCLSL